MVESVHYKSRWYWVEQAAVAPTPQTANSNLGANTAIAPPLLTPVENLDLTFIAHEIASKHDAGILRLIESKTLCKMPMLSMRKTSMTRFKYSM